MSAPLDRRGLLRRAGLLAGTLASGALLARCAPGQAPEGSPTATPRGADTNGAAHARPAHPLVVD